LHNICKAGNQSKGSSNKSDNHSDISSNKIGNQPEDSSNKRGAECESGEQTQTSLSKDEEDDAAIPVLSPPNLVAAVEDSAIERYAQPNQLEGSVTKVDNQSDVASNKTGNQPDSSSNKRGTDFEHGKTTNNSSNKEECDAAMPGLSQPNHSELSADSAIEQHAQPVASAQMGKPEDSTQSIPFNDTIHARQQRQTMPKFRSICGKSTW
jgi:hypothetical protein